MDVFDSPEVPELQTVSVQTDIQFVSLEDVQALYQEQKSAIASEIRAEYSAAPSTAKAETEGVLRQHDLLLHRFSEIETKM